MRSDRTGWPVIQQHGRLLKVRSKFYAKNVETTKSSKLALAEELATLGGCEPIYPLSEVTLLSVAGALDSAGYRHQAFKKVTDAVTRVSGPVKKAPEVKLSNIKHNR